MALPSDRAGGLRPEPPTASQPEALIPSAFDSLKQAMADDPEYAWGWHCNLAVPIMDAIDVSHEQANYAAAWLMMHLFECDTMAHPNYAYRGEQAHAQGIETGTDETRSGSVGAADESPVPEGGAP